MRNRSSSSGAVLIEAAIGFPLFILLILIVIWIALTAHARITLHTAVIKSTRVGITRGIRADIEGIHAINAIKTFRENGGNIPIYLYHQVDESAATTYYNDEINRFIGSTLQEMPSEYTYTLTYLGEWLRISLGTQVKFPCVTDGSSDAAGCLECRFLHPECHDLTPLTDSSTNCSRASFPSITLNGTRTKPAVSYTIDTMPRGRIELACQYQLPTSILTPIFSILSLISGGSTNHTLLIGANSISDAIPVPFPRVPVSAQGAN